MKEEIVVYQVDHLNTHIAVRVENESVWLNWNELAILFGRDVKTIGKHINNVLREELKDIPTVANFATVQDEGGRLIKRSIEYYNLDLIISVGYRVKSQRGIQFRIWANTILKDYLLKGYSINNRMNRIEDNVQQLVQKVNEIDIQINTNSIPNQGVFFDGQVFDAYALIATIIRSAQKNIVLIDNYIDESTLTHLSKKRKDVNVILLTRNKSKALELDVARANEQYRNFTLKTFNQSHDRFLIIDNQEVNHIGASLKDLGKKWFAFSKMDKNSVVSILEAIDK